MSDDGLRAVLRRDRVIVLASLGALALLAWAWLLLGAGTGARPLPGAGPMAAMAMPTQWTAAYAGLVLFMWAVMMLAMMLPSAAPVVLLVALIARHRAAVGGQVSASVACFVLGYALVWSGFSVAVTALQWRLTMSGLLSAEMQRIDALSAGVVLAAVGLNQWTPLKRACLRHCRSPLDFLLSHWRDGSLGAVVSGIRHGAFCLGCCWALMALLFVGGLMNLAWIAGISLLVLLEKAAPWGEQTSRIAGGVLTGWGVATIAAVA